MANPPAHGSTLASASSGAVTGSRTWRGIKALWRGAKAPAIFILGAALGPTSAMSGEWVKAKLFPDSSLTRVSLEHLCLDESVRFAFAGCGTGGVAKVAKGPYSYTSTWVGTKQGMSHSYLIDAGENSCTKIVIRFALPDGDNSRHYWATIYSTVDGKKQTAYQLEAKGNDYNSADSATIDVDRKPFNVSASVQDASKNGRDVDLQPLLLTGYALCDKDPS